MAWLSDLRTEEGFLGIQSNLCCFWSDGKAFSRCRDEKALSKVSKYLPAGSTTNAAEVSAGMDICQKLVCFFGDCKVMEHELLMGSCLEMFKPYSTAFRRWQVLVMAVQGYSGRSLDLCIHSTIGPGTFANLACPGN